MQALSQLSYGPTEGREFWGTGTLKSNLQPSLRRAAHRGRPAYRRQNRNPLAPAARRATGTYVAGPRAIRG
jgi:hypothetical protein